MHTAHSLPRRTALAAAVAVGLAMPAAASAETPTGYPDPIDAGGLATEVAAAHGALAWLTTPDGRPSSAQTTLHLRTPDATNDVAVRSDRRLARLSLGTDARGLPVVLAIAHDGALGGAQGGLRDPDVVRIGSPPAR